MATINYFGLALQLFHGCKISTVFSIKNCIVDRNIAKIGAGEKERLRKGLNMSLPHSQKRPPGLNL